MTTTSTPLDLISPYKVLRLCFSEAPLTGYIPRILTMAVRLFAFRSCHILAEAVQGGLRARDPSVVWSTLLVRLWSWISLLEWTLIEK